MRRRLALALLLAPAVGLPAQTNSQIGKASEYTPGPRDQQITATLPYAGTPADPLTLDVYRLHGRGPHPAVIIIHGGGFLHGTSRNGSEAYAADFLAPAGFAVFSINYHLASSSPTTPGANVQTMLADVQRAVRFVRHNSRQLEVDPGHIAILGGSAGGYLSNLAGVTPASAIPSPTDPVDREPDTIQAVVTLYGIADLSTMPDPGFVARLHLLGPETPTAEAIAAASPIHLVRPGTAASPVPPFLLIQGEQDESVPLGQSTRFLAALQAAGVPAKLITIPGGKHGTGGWHTLPEVPDWEQQTISWLNTTLHHHGPNTGEGIAPRGTASPATAPSRP